MSERMRTTLKAWPVITVLTIALCALTKVVAECVGCELPDQQNIAIVRDCLLHAFDSRRNLILCLVQLAQIVAIMPALEESIFRGLLFRLPAHFAPRGALFFALVSSVLFSAVHYFFQPFPDAAFVALAFFGFAQCLLYRKTGRIWCPIVTHALFNLTNVVLLVFMNE